MKKFLKIIAIIILLVLGFFFIKDGLLPAMIIEKRETIIGNATIIDVDYSAPYTTTIVIPCGKACVPSTQFHSAEYDVTFSFEDNVITVDDENLYEFVVNKVGRDIKVTMEKDIYKDGHKEYVLKNIIKN